MDFITLTFYRDFSRGSAFRYRYFQSCIGCRCYDSRNTIDFKSIRTILPKQPPKDPVLLEKDRQFRQCLPVLERIRLETGVGRGKLLKEYIQVMDNQYQKCLDEHYSVGQMLIEENKILQKLKQS